jgi:capsular polysaccharide transport system permease protein
MLELVRSQVNVVSALTIREMQNQNTKMQSGLGWALVEVLLYVGAISVIRVFIKAFMPPGMPPFTFLILGVMSYQIFGNTHKAIERVIGKNKKLLTLPVVTPLDLFFAAAIQQLCLCGIVFLGLISLSSYVENVGAPRFPMGVVLIFLSSWVMGIAFGLCFVPLLRIFPPSKYLFSPLKKAIFWTSGLYFVVTSMPPTLWPYLTWNPLLHICELMRTYWFETYNTPVGSPSYIFEVVGTMLVIGLSLERFIRRVPA